MLQLQTRKPSLAVYKFSSCDGCQLSLLDCEDELLAVAESVDIAYFVEARSAMAPGPYDVGLVEGSVTTAEEVDRIKQIRRQVGLLVAIGACATAGGIQALRNWADVAEFTRTVYATPSYIHTLEKSRPISDIVMVDFELRGCPISKSQLVDVVTSLLIGRKPQVADHGVCTECKRRGLVCVMAAYGTPCLGPVTQAGCGALCPAFGRGCYACFGPVGTANTTALGNRLLALGQTPDSVVRAFRSFNGYSLSFGSAGDRFEHEQATGTTEASR
jgi:coenzyme F420-reducing hydrogenase gamma subunit